MIIKTKEDARLFIRFLEARERAIGHYIEEDKSFTSWSVRLTKSLTEFNEYDRVVIKHMNDSFYYCIIGQCDLFKKETTGFRFITRENLETLVWKNRKYFSELAR